MAATLPAPPAATPVGAPGAAAPPAAGGILRGSRWTRLKAWLRLAYTDLGSKEHHLLVEWIVWMVIVSVVVTVLQRAEERRVGEGGSASRGPGERETARL